MRPYAIGNLDDLMMWLADGAKIEVRQRARWDEVSAVLPEERAIPAMLAGQFVAVEIPDRVLVEYIHFLQGELDAAGDAVAYKVA